MKIIAPQAPGGGVDFVARIIADKMRIAMGQPFVIENQAGAGGAIATQMAARAQPDGYTLMIGYVATHATNPAVKHNLGYDAVRDFTPIAMLGGTPNVLVVAKAVPVNTLLTDDPDDWLARAETDSRLRGDAALPVAGEAADGWDWETGR